MESSLPRKQASYLNLFLKTMHQLFQIYIFLPPFPDDLSPFFILLCVRGNYYMGLLQWFPLPLTSSEFGQRKTLEEDLEVSVEWSSPQSCSLWVLITVPSSVPLVKGKKQLLIVGGPRKQHHSSPYTFKKEISIKISLIIQFEYAVFILLESWLIGQSYAIITFEA